MLAGRLDRRIRIDRLSEGALNAFNEPSETWNEFTTIWASKGDVSDGEKMAAGQEYSAIISRFVARSTPDTRAITSDDRIFYEGKAWDILGVKEVSDERDAWVEMTAKRRSD